MQRILDTEPATTQRDEPNGQPQGPRPIDPADFKFIAGGLAPRNGWAGTTTTLPSTDLAPRNGW